MLKTSSLEQQRTKTARQANGRQQQRSTARQIQKPTLAAGRHFQWWTAPLKALATPSPFLYRALPLTLKDLRVSNAVGRCLPGANSAGHPAFSPSSSVSLICAPPPSYVFLLLLLLPLVLVLVPLLLLHRPFLGAALDARTATLPRAIDWMALIAFTMHTINVVGVNFRRRCVF